MTEPVVTVVVPGHDVGRYAAEALSSLQAQTLEAWTAVLVDDGSTDATTAVFAEAALADPRFRSVRHDRRLGLGAARNTGLDLVETPFVGFLDPDDVMVPGALARLVGLLDATGSDFAEGSYARLLPDSSGGYSLAEVQPWMVTATTPERHGITLEDHPEATTNIVAWSKVSRTAFWRRAGLRFPEDRLYEDQVVAQQMLVRARRFDVVPDVLVHWRVRADGTSITQGEAKIDVLRQRLDAMAAGLGVLDESGHTRAAEARARQLLNMDIPRLVAVAESHPDDLYRRTLGAFARTIAGRPTGSSEGRIPLDDDSARAVAAAVLW